MAAGVGTAVLRARGIDVRLDVGDTRSSSRVARPAAALWAAIAVGAGAVVRSQVSALEEDVP